MDMRKGLSYLGLAASLSLAATVAEAGFIIDDFNTSVSYTVSDSGAGAADNTQGIQNTGNYLNAPVTAGNTVLGVLGGPTGWTRQIYAELDVGDGVTTEICPNCQAAHSTAASGPSDGNSSFIYTTTTNPLDLSAYTGTTLDFLWAGDQPNAVLQVTFYEGSNSETYTISGLPDTGTASPADYVGVSTSPLTFGSVDETAIDGVRIDILGVPNLDSTLDVPVPATLALLGLGLVGLGWRRPRKA